MHTNKIHTLSYIYIDIDTHRVSRYKHTCWTIWAKVIEINVTKMRWVVDAYESLWMHWMKMWNNDLQQMKKPPHKNTHTHISDTERHNERNEKQQMVACTVQRVLVEKLLGYWAARCRQKPKSIAHIRPFNSPNQSELFINNIHGTHTYIHYVILYINTYIPHIVGWFYAFCKRKCDSDSIVCAWFAWSVECSWLCDTII